MPAAGVPDLATALAIASTRRAERVRPGSRLPDTATSTSDSETGLTVSRGAVVEPEPRQTGGPRQPGPRRAGGQAQRERGAEHCRQQASHCCSTLTGAGWGTPKWSRTSAATSRMAHCRGSPVGGRQAAEQQRPEGVAAVQGAMAAAADVRLTAPVDELEARRRRQQDLARGRTDQCGPGASQRVGVGGRLETPVAEAPVEDLELALDAPATPARPPARPRGRSAAPPGRGSRTPPRGGLVSVALEPHHQVDSLEVQRAGDHRGAHRVALGLVQGVDHRRPLGRAHGDPGIGRRVCGRELAGGPQDAQLGELVLERDLAVTGAWEWSAITIIACSSRNRSTPPPASSPAPAGGRPGRSSAAGLGPVLV